MAGDFKPEVPFFKPEVVDKPDMISWLHKDLTTKKGKQYCKGAFADWEGFKIKKCKIIILASDEGKTVY